MIIINIDLPELESISSVGYSLWSPRKVIMNSILIISILINIDVPKCYIIEMGDALKFVKNVTISSSSNEMNDIMNE